MSGDILELHKQLMDSIEELDKQLDSTLDSDTNLQKMFIDEKVTEQKDTIKEVVTGFIAQVKEEPIDAQVGLFYGFQRAFNEAFLKPMKEYVEKQVATLPKPEPLITLDQIPEVAKQRSEAYQSIKQIVDLAGKLMNLDLPMPKMRKGRSGKRGPRKLTFFEWTINETPVDGLKGVVELYPQYGKVGDLTKAMRENKTDSEGKEIPDSGLNLTDPPTRLEYMLPDGNVLVGELNEDKWKLATTAGQTTESTSDDDDLELDDDEEGNGEETSSEVSEENTEAM
jgi:hypothetical protein